MSSNSESKEIEAKFIKYVQDKNNSMEEIKKLLGILESIRKEYEQIRDTPHDNMDGGKKKRKTKKRKSLKKKRNTKRKRNN